MALVQVGEIELDCERSGAGPPLLLIMGMSGTMLHWGEPFLGRLRQDFELIAYDHRGVGSSTRLHGAVTIAGLAADAAGLLAALEIDCAHVLGISMGGMVAQELVLANPPLVRTLTLGCTYCGGPGSSLTAPAVLQRLTEAMLSGERERALRTAYEVNVSARAAADSEAYASFRAIADRRAVAVPVTLAQMRACAEHDTHARLGGLQTPTLVVHGSADQVIPVINAPLIAQRIPNSRLEILDDAGHMFMWEHPDRAAGLVRERALAAV